tara:strand:- start:2475 stop:3263 length:789 start_codon:yes stop_codon:yes gene_type:complete
MYTDFLHLLFSELKPWLTIISSFGAFASAVAALFALRHMKSQTKSSYKPDLYLAFYTSNNINYHVNEFSFPFTVTTGEQTIETHGLLYTIENIGFGAAKDIQIKWLFDFDKAIDYIEKDLKDILTVEKTGPVTHFNTKAPKNSYPFVLESFDTTTFDFVLPRKDEKFRMSPCVPDNITTLLRMYFMLKEELYTPKKHLPYILSLDFSELKGFPVPTAKISYLDIGGNSHKKTFKVSFYISIYRDKISNDLLQFNISPEFKEV